MKTSKFQQTFKKSDAIEIVKIFHPGLTHEQIEANIKFGPSSYYWVGIEFKVRDYGKISIGISNYNCHKLSGPSISKDMIEKAIKHGDIYFRCWRFWGDKFADREKYGTLERDALELQSSEYLSKNYRVMSVNEFYHQYYKD